MSRNALIASADCVAHFEVQGGDLVDTKGGTVVHSGAVNLAPPSGESGFGWDDYATISGLTLQKRNFTVIGWSSSVPVQGHSIYFEDGAEDDERYGLSINSTGTIRGYVNSSLDSSSLSVPTGGAWGPFAFAFDDSANLGRYSDGATTDDDALAFTGPGANTATSLLRLYGYTGGLYGVAWFNRTLSAAEIAQYFAGEVPPQPVTTPTLTAVGTELSWTAGTYTSSGTLLLSDAIERRGSDSDDWETYASGVSSPQTVPRGWQYRIAQTPTDDNGTGDANVSAAVTVRESCNSLYESADLLIPGQDSSGGTAVGAYSEGAAQADATWQGGTIGVGVGPGGGFATALDFNGIDQHVDHSTKTYAGAFTISWRSKADGVPGSHYIILGSTAPNNDYLSFYLSDRVRIRLVTSTSTVEHGVTITDWHHWVLTRDDDGDIHLYVDGSYVDTLDTSNSEVFDVDKLCNYSSNSLRFAGLVCDLGHRPVATPAPGVAEINDGFEPRPLGGTLAANGNFEIDTPALGPAFLDGVLSGDNGAVSFEAVAALADGTVVDTASTATGTFDFSGLSDGTNVFLYGRLSNSGGYDLGDANATRLGGFNAGDDDAGDDGYYELATVATGPAPSPLVESFSQADSSDLGPDLAWLEPIGDLATASGRVVGPGYAVANHPVGARPVVVADVLSGDHPKVAAGVVKSVGVGLYVDPLTGDGVWAVASSDDGGTLTLRVEERVGGVVVATSPTHNVTTPVLLSGACELRAQVQSTGRIFAVWENGTASSGLPDYTLTQSHAGDRTGVYVSNSAIDRFEASWTEVGQASWALDDVAFGAAATVEDASVTGQASWALDDVVFGAEAGGAAEGQGSWLLGDVAFSASGTGPVAFAAASWALGDVAFSAAAAAPSDGQASWSLDDLVFGSAAAPGVATAAASWLLEGVQFNAEADVLAAAQAGFEVGVVFLAGSGVPGDAVGAWSLGDVAFGAAAALPGAGGVGFEVGVAFGAEASAVWPYGEASASWSLGDVVFSAAAARSAEAQVGLLLEGVAFNAAAGPVAAASASWLLGDLAFGAAAGVPPVAAASWLLGDVEFGAAAGVVGRGSLGVSLEDVAFGAAGLGPSAVSAGWVVDVAFAADASAAFSGVVVGGSLFPSDFVLGG